MILSFSNSLTQGPVCNSISSLYLGPSVRGSDVRTGDLVRPRVELHVP